MRSRSTAACLLLIAAAFLPFALGGLNAYFTPDDGGNLLHAHRYFETSFLQTAFDAIRVVTSSYRPLGGLFYRTFYSVFGLSALPFRVACLALMLCNTILVFHLLQRLTGVKGSAAIGAVLLSTHPALLWLFYSTGTVYEILCFLFYVAALIYYAGIRQRSRAAGLGTAPLTWRQNLALLALTGLALDSKEMAVTLPAALCLLEVCFFVPEKYRFQDQVRHMVRQCIPILLTGLLTAAAIAVKLLLPNPLSEDPRYRFQGVSSLFDALRYYHGMLIYKPDLTLVQMAVGWLAVIVVAVVLRSRIIIFGACLWILTLLPVSVIGPHGGYMLYLPLLGWSLIIAAAFSALINQIPSYGRSLLGFSIAAITAGGITALHGHQLAPFLPSVVDEQQNARRLVSETQKALPVVPKDSFLLLVTDHYSENWGLSFLLPLAYRDPSLLVSQVSSIDRMTPNDLTLYDRILRDDGRTLMEVPQEPLPPSAGTRIEFQPGTVRPGQQYTVSIASYANQSISVAVKIHTPGSASQAVVTGWCTLDGQGRAILSVPPNFQPATLEIVRVRGGAGPWERGSGQLKVER